MCTITPGTDGRCPPLLSPSLSIPPAPGWLPAACRPPANRCTGWAAPCLRPTSLPAWVPHPHSHQGPSSGRPTCSPGKLPPVPLPPSGRPPPCAASPPTARPGGRRSAPQRTGDWAPPRLRALGRTGDEGEDRNEAPAVPKPGRGDFGAPAGIGPPPSSSPPCRVSLLPARLRHGDAAAAAAGGGVGAPPCVRRCGSPASPLPSPFLSPRRFYVCL